MRPSLALAALLLAAPLAAGAAEAYVVHGKAAFTRAAAAPALRAGGLDVAVSRITLRALPKSKAAAPPDEKRARVGEARDVALDADAPAPPLQWMPLASGGHAARLALASPGAQSLRVALRARGLPAGAELAFVSPAHPERVAGPVGGATIERAMQLAGRYWSPLTEGAEQQVEVWLPPGASPEAVSVEIVAASHIHVAPSSMMKSTGVGGAQGCEEDVACVAPSNPALERASRSVARLLYTDNGVSYLCTGTLVSDSDTQSQVPYLYTAAHCIGSQAEAATLNTFWFFQAASCNGKSSIEYKQLSGGATLLYANSATDASLLRLDEPAPDGAWFSGWSGEALAPDAPIVALHHPAGDLKKVSLGLAMGAVGPYTEAAWLTGTTEGGSSGSGLFTLEGGEYVLRGALRGGSASCTSSGNVADPSNRDYYSRLDEEAPQLVKWLSAAPAPLADYSGMWFDPDEPGWGLAVLQNADNHVFATWYHYDASRRPTWLVLPQVAWTSAATLEGSLYRPSGSSYLEAYDPARFSITPAGTMRVEFASDGTATVTATIDGANFVRKVTRLAF